MRIFCALLVGTLLCAMQGCTPWKTEKINGYLEDRGVLRIDDAHAVSYIRGGSHDGQRVIFVHGTPGSAKAFEHYVAVTPAGSEAISIDRYGFGESLPKKSVPSIKEQASALEPFLMKQNGKWPILVGHSLGGPIVARAAVDYPGRVAGIIILAGAFDPSLEKVTPLQKVGDFAFVPSLLPSEIRNMNEELIPLKGELEQLQPLLKNIRCPVVIIHGTKDTLVPFSNVEYLRRNLRPNGIRAEFILYGENHFIPWTCEPVVRGAIQLLLEEKK